MYGPFAELQIQKPLSMRRQRTEPVVIVCQSHPPSRLATLCYRWSSTVVTFNKMEQTKRSPSLFDILKIRFDKKFFFWIF
jgi:hypothetical protein